MNHFDDLISRTKPVNGMGIQPKTIKVHCSYCGVSNPESYATKYVKISAKTKYFMRKYYTEAILCSDCFQKNRGFNGIITNRVTEVFDGSDNSHIAEQHKSITRTPRVTPVFKPMFI